jgi:ABC-2 type transport system ATP-binding protein
MIEIKNANKRFRRTIALQDVSLQVPAGSVFALLGENGAGKSTLIRAMLGYIKLDSGSIVVKDLDPYKQPLELRRQVGYLSDAPALYDWMKVSQIGWFTSGFYPEGFLKRFAMLVDEFELPIDAKIRHLSKGQKGKLALALVIAADPDLFIMDEPTSGLDPQVRRQFLESMADLAAEGKTILLSSHHIPEVERVANWIAILHQGRVRVCGPIEAIKQTVQNLTFSLHDPLAPLPIEIDDLCRLSTTISGRSVSIVAQGINQEFLNRLSSNERIFDVQAHRINLEELYLAVMKSDSGWTGCIMLQDEIPETVPVETSLTAS